MIAEIVGISFWVWSFFAKPVARKCLALILANSICAIGSYLKMLFGIGSLFSPIDLSVDKLSPLFIFSWNVFINKSVLLGKWVIPPFLIAVESRELSC